MAIICCLISGDQCQKSDGCLEKFNKSIQSTITN